MSQPVAGQKRRRLIRLCCLGALMSLVVGSLSLGFSPQPASAAISVALQQVPVRIAPASAAGAQCLDIVGGPSAAVAGSVLQQYACQLRTQYNQVFKIGIRI